MILNRGDHLGIVGFNGAGKSTLLKTLAQNLKLIEGSLEYGHMVTSSLFSQHSAEQLNLESTVFESMAELAHPQVTQQEVLNMAGSLLFSGDAIQKKIKVLSGGEKSRVALGQILLQKSPLLLLDEPTNHLDFDTVEALTEALKNYEGSLVTVSHDRGFVKRVASKILEVNNGELTLYPGTYDEYVWSLQKGVLAERSDSEFITASSVDKKSSDTMNGKFNYKEERKRLESNIKKSYQQISKLEKEIDSHQHELLKLNEEILSVQGLKAAELSKNIFTISSVISDKENQILNLMEIIETDENELNQLVN